MQRNDLIFIDSLVLEQNDIEAKEKPKSENHVNDLSGLSSLQKELANRSNLPTQETLTSTLNAKNTSFQPSNMFNNAMFMEMQRRMYASALNQQQTQQNGRNNDNEDNSMVRDAVMKDFFRFVQTLNEKFTASLQKVYI